MTQAKQSMHAGSDDAVQQPSRSVHDVSEQAAIFQYCSKISPSFKALQWPQDKGEAAQERRSYRLAQAVNDTSPPTARSPCPLHSFVAATFLAMGQSHSEAHNALVAGTKHGVHTTSQLQSGPCQSVASCAAHATQWRDRIATRCTAMLCACGVRDRLPACCQMLS